MKNNLCLKKALLLFGLCLGSLWISAQSKSVLVGEIRNGVATVTNIVEATRVLKGGLSDAAVVSDINIEWVGGNENKYYLLGTVTNDKVTSKGITLHQDGTSLAAATGPGVEISCIGFNCSDCRLRFTKWRPYCHCEDPAPKSDMRCDMTSKVMISF